MKKQILNIALMLIAVLLLGSCSDRKDGALTVLYSVTLSDDMDQIADMAITYKLADGSTAIDTITGRSWDKTVVLDTFPAAFGMVDYTFIPKPASSLKKDEYETSVIFSMFTREFKFELETRLVNIDCVRRDKVAGLFDLANDHGGTGIIKIASKEGNTFRIDDSDPDTEKISMITENTFEKIFPNKASTNDTTINNP